MQCSASCTHTVSRVQGQLNIILLHSWCSASCTHSVLTVQRQLDTEAPGHSIKGLVEGHQESITLC
jgi:hypothetical protein